MRKIGAILGITALAGVVFSPPPAAAFGIRVGPFYLHVPFLGHHYHHHHLHMRANPNEARNGPNDVPRGGYSPARGGKAKSDQTERDALAETNTEALERCTGLAPGVTDLPIDQIRLTVRPTTDQEAALNDLSAASSQASDSIEVVQAQRWVSAHPNVHGDALQDALQQEQWDASVKGLTAVPQVLSMMNDKLDWTQQLGEAFLAQPNDVSNAIQQLRAKAEANGNLKSSDKIRVSRMPPPEPPPPGPVPVGVDAAYLPPPPPPEYIVIEPVDPGVYYVPIYDPYVVYGPWLWPAYQPFYWYPPGYVLGAAVIGFGVGFFVGSALWCHYNWGWHGGWAGGGPVTINVFNYNRFNHANLAPGQNHWQFDAAHRGAVGFQNASLRQQFGTPRNFEEKNFQGTRGTLQGNLQGSQGQFHIQGNQGNALQGNQSRGGNPKFNTNANINSNTRVNTNANVNTNRHVNTNANVNINRNLNVNQNQNQNRNVNRNANVNRNFNGGGNQNRGGNNFIRNAGPPGGGGGGKGGPGGRGGRNDEHGHH
jgi:hypothetical protein